MINSLKYKIKLLIGLINKEYTITKIKRFEGFNAIIKMDEVLIDELKEYSYEFIFTEFGKERVNAGGAILNNDQRLEPSLSGIKKYFPKAKITVYTDFEWDREDIDIIKVESPVVFPNHPRFGYRTGNYFKFKGLVESKADFVCALDTDMYFVNDNVYSLVTLTKKFGFCAPYNIRQLLKMDMRISMDTQEINDDSLGNGHSYNQSPMTLWKGDSNGKLYYLNCMEIMKDDPSRGSLVMWKAAYKTGIYPYILPKQFCVCEGDQGCGDEIILHIGHPNVSKFYKL